MAPARHPLGSSDSPGGRARPPRKALGELTPGQREVLRSLTTDVNAVIRSQEEKSAKLLTVMSIGSGLVAFAFSGGEDPEGLELVGLTLAVVCLVEATMMLLAALESRGAHAHKFQLGHPYGLRHASPSEVVAAVRALSDHAGVPRYYARQAIRRSHIAWYKATLHNLAVLLITIALIAILLAVLAGWRHP